MRAAGYADEGEEVFGLTFVAAVQTSAAGKPGDRSSDDPAVAAQPGGGLDALAGDMVTDSALTEPSAQVVVVVFLVGMELGGRRRRGPRRERMGGIPRTSGSRPRLSCVLEAEIPRDRGSPLRSVIRSIFDPCLPRSVGFGPVSGLLLRPGC